MVADEDEGHGPLVIYIFAQIAWADNFSFPLDDDGDVWPALFPGGQ